MTRKQITHLYVWGNLGFCYGYLFSFVFSTNVWPIWAALFHVSVAAMVHIQGKEVYNAPYRSH
jgi:hypothetical protein